MIFGDDAIFSVFLGKNPEDGSKNYKLYSDREAA